MTPEGVIFRTTSWQHLSAIPSHPLVEELRRYVEWKMVNSKMTRKGECEASKRAQIVEPKTKT